MTGSATWTGLTTTNVTSLFSSGLYANFHSSAKTGGELRGQFIQVPSPAAATLFGFVGLIGSRRRRN